MVAIIKATWRVDLLDEPLYACCDSATRWMDSSTATYLFLSLSQRLHLSPTLHLFFSLI